jgi:hypothetical protein
MKYSLLLKISVTKWRGNGKSKLEHWSYLLSVNL